MNDDDWRQEIAFRHAITRPDQLDAINAGSGLAVSFTPPGKSIDLSFDGSQSKSLSIWRTASRSGFMSKPKLEAALVTIRFVDRGAIVQIDRRGRDRIAGAGQAILTAFDAMRLDQATPGFSAVSATVSREAVVAACRRMFGPDSAAVPLFGTVVDLRSPALVSVRATVAALHRRLTEDDDAMDLVRPLVEEVLLYQLVGCWPLVGRTEGDHVGDATDRAVKRAIDYIEGNLSRAIAIHDIAQAAGLSVRCLQIGFKRRIGCSPVQYLIARRLDRVHADLLDGDGQTIRAVAQRWGFVHLSDFAARYRDRFGFLPRDTRR